jgi:hypothetical protein
LTIQRLSFREAQGKDGMSGRLADANPRDGGRMQRLSDPGLGKNVFGDLRGPHVDGMQGSVRYVVPAKVSAGDSSMMDPLMTGSEIPIRRFLGAR